MLTYDESSLANALGMLPPVGRVAFATACAGRLAGPCKSATRELGLNAPDLVQVTLDDLWRFLADGGARDWAQRADDLIALIPDEDSIFTAAHQVIEDALAATAYAARTAADGNEQEAAYCARRLYEAADAFAQRSLSFAIYTPQIEEAVARHAVVQQELTRQLRDVEELGRPGGIDAIRLRAGLEDALPT